ncbi:sugar transferase [Candidatus Stoquefichus sp. SB1]|uniref:sugar transferase n=1 Tax=Candidatus Stoquefichus sp. SB1 TaxID=1658109 RepID=UPI00067E98EE|nr:sugar transferase [Candidatus Stoquefichus sp. SB1]
MYKVFKRIIDFTLSLFGLIVLLLPMGIIALLIKKEDGGPILFLQDRMGINGQKFKIYKFRTMIENAENVGTGLDSYSDDFRVTKIGYFLRNTSLDEIPQLFNILKGDMSIVGPRPPVYKTFINYPNIDKKFLIRFTVKPGITGLAQVNGRNELSWDEKIIYDKKYVESCHGIVGFIQDLKIIFKTIIKVLKNEGAYDKEGN